MPRRSATDVAKGWTKPIPSWGILNQLAALSRDRVQFQA